MVAQKPTSATDEALVVVPTRVLRDAGLKDGFDPSADRILAAAFSPGTAQTLPRSLAELDERYKQLVCYVILLYGCTVFSYQRSALAGEKRLAGRRSLGLGGHLNAADGSQVDGRTGLDRAVRRELAEEVKLATDPDVQIVGVINDDSNQVGRVHLGLVIVARLTSPEVKLRDPTLADGRFDALDDLVARQEEFETWSRLCMPGLAELLERGRTWGPPAFPVDAPNPQ